MKCLFRQYLLILLLTYCNLLSGIAQSASYKTPDSWYQDYDVKFYKIDLNASYTSRYIEGCGSVLSKSLINNLNNFTIELGDHLLIDSILFNGKKANYNHRNDLVNIFIPTYVGKGEMMMVTIYYKGTVPTNGFFSGLSNKKDSYWQVPVTWTLSESFRAKDWFPCKQYLPDKADSVWVFITVPNNRKVGSNGTLTAIKAVGNKKNCYQWKSHYPTAYYLISFTVGDFQEYNYYTKFNNQDSLLIQNYIYNKPGYLLKNKHLIDNVGDYLTYFSSLFGPYPFIKEKYGHCLAPIQGGMEHQTMATLANFEFTLVTHELAHQWFGDWVTCKSWQDIWINEGFASYGEYLSLDRFESHLAAKNWMDNAHYQSIQDSIGTVYIPNEDKNNELRIFNSNLTYKKGAAIIHQMRYELNNDSLFFEILRQFLLKYADSVASGNDFEQMVSTLTHQDWSWFFNQWYYGKGYPKFEVSWRQYKDTLYIASREIPSASGMNTFKMHMDLSIKFNNTDSLIQYYQDQKEVELKIPLKNDVDKIILDPEHKCLMKIMNVAKVSRFKNNYGESSLFSKSR